MASKVRKGGSPGAQGPGRGRCCDCHRFRAGCRRGAPAEATKESRGPPWQVRSGLAEVKSQLPAWCRDPQDLGRVLTGSEPRQLGHSHVQGRQAGKAGRAGEP